MVFGLVFNMFDELIVEYWEFYDMVFIDVDKGNY